ncbi:hypothetical protein [Microvirga arabica]|nr:hypothetical protein [Microvirga arabica]
MSGMRVVAAVVCLVAASSLASAKERRLWADPPPESTTPAPSAPASTPVNAEPAPLIDTREDIEVTGSIQAWPQPALDTEEPLSPPPLPRSSCTTRAYKVLSGATVRVHAC